jgi:hypothetical protein
MAHDPLDDLMMPEYGDRRRGQTAAQRRASLRNLAKARKARRHGNSADRHRPKHHKHKKRGSRGGMYGLFGNVFGDRGTAAQKRAARANLGKARRAWKAQSAERRAMLKKRARKLEGWHKIGKVSPAGRKGAFRSVTRGGSVWEGYVTKGKKRGKRR